VAAQPGTPNKAARCPTTTGDDQKPVIVTSISRKRARQRRAGYAPAEPDDEARLAPADDTLMKAMARMLRRP
jgi:hypothetical protein